MKKWLGFQNGINLGGWLSQCQYRKEHYDSFITEADIKRLSSWGLDHVRLPVDYQVIEGVDEFGTAEGLVYIDRCIAWCRKYQLNLIIDLHKVPGFSFDAGDENSLFDNLQLQDKFVAIWESLSKLYGKYSNFTAFELLNEIVEKDSTKWNVLAERAIRVIREHAPQAKIVVGGIQWNSVHTLDQLTIPLDENIVYNFHFYEPFLFTHQSAPWQELIPAGEMPYPGELAEYRQLAGKINAFGSGLYNSGIIRMGTEYMESLMEEAVKAADEKGVSLYCGEYGAICLAPAESIKIWYEDIHYVFETLGIGRAAWTYKGMHFGISDLYKEDIRESVISNL